ncbi:hypothetical protein ASPZODRAFT_170261 [Penicilliopsis zonata CBS 506.65]|uniref:Methyltransferase domain-containing protein n=1 Tax=Penicilliopsis zonata CBS 506.65 TaxID=1073090 RepID=A0A1L9S568_9EURO|nr:hypothetical protein ASPZODRAFT_170261 [Penicilliopsis zonata CBS 506.65]OJJ42306.1 hypothetical protein ASPZODRAFT_170261 [Penicilliopsis zonata CBS 506.65]
MVESTPEQSNTHSSPPAEADLSPAPSPTADSAVGSAGSESSYGASLLSEVKNYKYENGRRYHSYREGQYVLPNDEMEQDREDLLHHIRSLLFQGRLYHAPLKKDISAAFDIGTGTGIWAMDFADEFPSTKVIGTDLSPIQPVWIPPNIEFFVDDAESDWTFKKGSFDFVRACDLGGAIADWAKLLQQTYEHLKPGGWIELLDFAMDLHSENGSPEQQAPHAMEFFRHLKEASSKFNRPMDVAGNHINRLKTAGFIDVEERIYRFPDNPWPTDPILREAGRYNQEATSMGLDSYGTALFSRVLGWNQAEITVFLAAVRKEIQDVRFHLYVNAHVVWGRRPEATGL